MFCSETPGGSFPACHGFRVLTRFVICVFFTEDGLIDGLSPQTLWEDDNTKVIQGLLVEVEEAYAHCPRAFLFSKLWDLERLGESLQSDPNRYWFGRWKEGAA